MSTMTRVSEGVDLNTIHADIPFEDYCAWPHINGSTLSQAFLGDASVSMRHLKAALDGKIPHSTKPLSFGRAYHHAVLEPQTWKQHFAVVRGCNAKKKDGDECGNSPSLYHEDTDTWYCKVKGHAPEGCVDPRDANKHCISVEDFEHIKQMLESLKKHDSIYLLRTLGGREVSAVAELEVAPGKHVLVKGRFDKDTPHPPGHFPPFIADLKSCARGKHDDKSFISQAMRLNYDLKAALYVDLAERCDGIRRDFIWIAQEKEFPYDINTVKAPRWLIDRGRRKYQYVLSRYLECKATGVWPGYSSDIHTPNNEYYKWGDEDRLF